MSSSDLGGEANKPGLNALSFAQDKSNDNVLKEEAVGYPIEAAASAVSKSGDLSRLPPLDDVEPVVTRKELWSYYRSLSPRSFPQCHANPPHSVL